MSAIGYFKKIGNGFNGEIQTLNLRANNVRIVEVPESKSTEPSKSGGPLPSHRVFVGRAEIGAVWSKVSDDGVPYFSVKLDDPSFASVIYANLICDTGDDYMLIWSRR